MKFADLLSRLFSFLPRTASLDAAIDNAVWLISGCSTALGLALAAALIATRQHVATAIPGRSESESQQFLCPPSNGNT